jgi:ATP-dependent DNA helicase RecG
MELTLKTPILHLHRVPVGGLSAWMSKHLAAAVAGFADKAEPETATVEDLLNYFPARYEDRSKFIGIDELFDGIEASVELFVKISGGFQVGKNRGPRQPPLFIFELTACDRERTQKPVVVWWFLSGRNAKPIIEYYEKRFARGVRLVAHGRWEWDERRNTFALKVAKPEELEVLPDGADPDAFGLLQGEARDEPVAVSEPTRPDEGVELDQDIESPEFATVHTARCVPIYRKLGRFQTKRLREIIFDVLQKLECAAIPDNLPVELVERNKLCSRAEALSGIHFPPDGVPVSDYERFRSPAQTRLIFEEFFWLSFALQLVRGERLREPKGTVIEIPDSFKKRVAALLPFKLTGTQRRVVRRILGDMTSDAPMNRLIQGDVGSGKTIVAFIAMFAAMENGYQGVLMAPTEILAEQHFRNAERFFSGTSYQAALLIGSMKASEKRQAQAATANGDVALVIGTHALIQDAVEFENLGLAVIDEQHRFGVLQRAALKKSGLNPDVLVMSATPIPRSLAMTVYGDLDVSVIDEMPPGRTPVKTVVVGEDKRRGVYKGIEREIALGRQVYVVYPLIEESEKLDLKAATAMFEELRDRIFPKRRVGLLHGKMKTSDKDAIMARFVAGELDILVSTTVIEVGVDVANASVMVIEHAERFGLSQLHQLRGRVGRGSEKSYCVLLTGDKKTAVARERLGIMEETNDGFKIAEKDLEIRGQGEILGTRQSGIQMFRIANIIRDLELLESARAEAEKYLTDKRLTQETAALAAHIRGNAKFRLAGIG